LATREENQMSTLDGSPNILLIIADDLGQDVVNIAGSGVRTMEVHTHDGIDDIHGALPNISRFLRNGLYFEQAWAQPACSPTRASIYAGLQPWKSGVGSPKGTPELDPAVSFVTLPELLPSSYVSGLFGKWHLGDMPPTGTGPGTYPTDHGWDKHVGTLRGVITRPGDPSSGYTDWDMVDSDDAGYPTLNPTSDHATWATVREAASWINGLTADTPWFATIAFHAPHDPFHIPWVSGNPGAGIGFDPGTAGNTTHNAYMFNVMTQNLDYNIGRLIGTVSGGFAGVFDFDPIPEEQLENTVIIFIGDNGSPEGSNNELIALEEPKTTIYEYGVRVPMIIADGQALVNGINSQARTARFLHRSALDRTSLHMVHVVDLYKTVVKLADPSAEGFPQICDSIDLSNLLTFAYPMDVPGRPRPKPKLPAAVRRFNFSQWYTSNNARATIRNDKYKLNCIKPNFSQQSQWSLYKYDSDGKIPGREDEDTATNLFDDALDGTDTEAQENLNELLDELLSNYQLNETIQFEDEDPRSP